MTAILNPLVANLDVNTLNDSLQHTYLADEGPANILTVNLLKGLAMVALMLSRSVTIFPLALLRSIEWVRWVQNDHLVCTRGAYSVLIFQWNEDSDL